MRRQGRKRELLVAAVACLVALVVVNLPPQVQSAARHLIRETALRPFLELNGAIATARDRAFGFDAARQRLDSLVLPAMAHRRLVQENRELRGLLGLADRHRHRAVGATVIRLGRRGSESVFHLDIGLASGVTPFAAVITEDGLLGQVQEVFGDYSVGHYWSHPDFRVAAMTPDARAHGIVEVARGALREQDRLVIRGTAFLSELDPGDELVTSGRGGTFPAGIRVGSIDGPAEESAGWSRSYYVVPAVHPGLVAHALAYTESGTSAVATSSPRPDGEGEAR